MVHFTENSIHWNEIVIDYWPVPIVHLSGGPLNIPAPQRSELIGPNGGKPCDGSNGPGGERKTGPHFFRFFHFARRFWNHTCKRTDIFNPHPVVDENSNCILIAVKRKSFNTVNSTMHTIEIEIRNFQRLNHNYEFTIICKLISPPWSN